MVRHFTTLAQVQSLFGELRFCKLCGTVKKVFPSVGMLNIFFFLHPPFTLFCYSYFALLIGKNVIYHVCMFLLVKLNIFSYVCWPFVNLCTFSIFLLR